MKRRKREAQCFNSYDFDDVRGLCCVLHGGIAWQPKSARLAGLVVVLETRLFVLAAVKPQAMSFMSTEHEGGAVLVLAGRHGVRVWVRVQQPGARVPEAAGRPAEPVQGALADTALVMPSGQTLPENGWKALCRSNAS